MLSTWAGPWPSNLCKDWEQTSTWGSNISTPREIHNSGFKTSEKCQKMETKSFKARAKLQARANANRTKEKVTRQTYIILNLLKDATKAIQKWRHEYFPPNKNVYFTCITNQALTQVLTPSALPLIVWCHLLTPQKLLAIAAIGNGCH